ncbi:MAG: hypothetical protein WC007_04615 [Pelobacteraceae bacterium]
MSNLAITEQDIVRGYWDKSKNVACMLDIESKVVTVYQYPEVILGKIKL